MVVLCATFCVLHMYQINVALLLKPATAFRVENLRVMRGLLRPARVPRQSTNSYVKSSRVRVNIASSFVATNAEEFVACELPSIRITGE